MGRNQRDEPISAHVADPPGTGNWGNDDAAVVAAIAALHVDLEKIGVKLES